MRQSIKHPLKLTTKSFHNVNKLLPKIILVGAQTSSVTFLYPLITQWYWNFSAVVQFCFDAILLQSFLRAASSHSALDFGQDSTISTLLTASRQYLFTPIHDFGKELKNPYALYLNCFEYQVDNKNWRL